MSTPNVIAMADIMLVLLIIFMVITPKTPAGLPTVIPQPAPPPSKAKRANPDTVVVQVRRGGKLMINRDPSDWNSLGPR